MYHFMSVRSWVFIIWAVFTSAALYVRPLLPIDETRYAAVAWEMWLHSNFLVPHLNGELYSHKPPLLFWLMHSTWALFGVNDWSLRLVAPLFALGTVYLSIPIARLTWPEREEIGELVPFMLLGSFFWVFFSTLTMFDMMLAFFVALGMYSLLRLAEVAGPAWRYRLLLGAAIGGGVLTKGPVVVLHVLPAALLTPWWRPGRRNWLQWYGGLLFSILLGATIALCWAIPAGIEGGETYRNAIFWGQTKGRLVESFAHQLPWWWYAQFLPALLLPWLLFKQLWKGLKTLNWQDSGLRFCVAWGLPVFISFSLISGKRAHYLLPLAPVLILVLARALTGLNLRTVDWKHSNRWLLAMMVAIGALMAAAPWAGPLLLHNAELSQLSPGWGIALLASAALLWTHQTKTAQESILSACVSSVALLLAVSSAFFSVRNDRFDMRETGNKIAEVQADNKEVAYLTGIYHGEYQFAGRLTKPVQPIPSLTMLEAWSHQHPGAYVLIRYKRATDLPAVSPYFHHRYKGMYVSLLPADTLLNSPELKNMLRH